MKFFKPEDFNELFRMAPSIRQEAAARIANEKLEKESIQIFGSRDKGEWSFAKQDEKNNIVISSNFKNSYYKGFLVNIEPLEKCKHPPEKVKFIIQKLFECSCGASLTPDTFKEV